MTGIRKYKRIIACFLILAILLFSKPFGYFWSYPSSNFNVEDSIKSTSSFDHFSNLILSRDYKHFKILKITKNVNFESFLIRNQYTIIKVFTSFDYYKSIIILINTSILKLNCILRI